MSDNKKLSPEKVWKLYQNGISFNNRMGLDEEVENNENFFIGKQWEGVQSNGLPTPVFNFLKRVTLFTVATVSTDNLKMQASPMGAQPCKGDIYRTTSVVNREFESIFERGDISGLVREYVRNAAVDGDGCTYSYWDPELETGQQCKGGIVTELIENTRVYFGNPGDRRVQKQPYIIIERVRLVSEARKRAKEAGIPPESIRPDDTERRKTASEQLNEDDRVTMLLYFYKDDKSGCVRCYECTKTAALGDRELGLKLYPITWLNWDYRLDNYHGQALISGLIPNQIFINKLFAMSMISLMTTAYPKIIYDKTRISRWDNRVGAAIGINGGDVASAAKIIDPAQISPQIAEFIRLAVDYTEKFLGATPVALGDAKPDNTSAILALQRAAATPHEITRRNLYARVEELGRIYIDFMSVYYGVRTVGTSLPREAPEELVKFAGFEPDGEMQSQFDFSSLRDMPMQIKLDVGASAYWSEIAAMQTLDNLLAGGQIQLEDYLERLPEGYVPQKHELLDKLKGAKETMEKMKGALSGMQDSAAMTGAQGAPEQKNVTAI